MALETVASNDLAFGLSGAEIVGLGLIAVATYYVGARIFRTLSGEKPH